MASSIASQEPHFVGKHSPTSSSLSISIGAAPSTCECSDPERALTPQISRMSHDHAMSMKAASVGTTGTTDPNFEVDWEDESDIENPKNWPTWYKGIVIGLVSYSTVVLYSSSYTSGLAQMQDEFHVSEPVATLGVTTYLVGLAVGSVILAPISEIYGRRPVYMVTMFLFMVLVIPTGLGNSLVEVLVVRFFGAVAGSAMISNSPGTVNDIVNDEYRALAFSVWSIGPLNGPVFGPIIGGWITQGLGWRWTNWVVMILSSIAWFSASIIKETYSPALLVKKARKRRSETGDLRWWSRYDQKTSFIQLLKVNLSRPFVMAVSEPICIFWNIYIAIIYAILYLCFVAYPIVFTEIRGWSSGISGLAFLGIGVGCMSAILSEPLLRRMINAHEKDPITGRVAPEAMVSVICIAACLSPIGTIWFAWTCTPPTYWIWSILAGIPFGAGNVGIFIYASNYLANSYGIYAASAMAGNAVVRSILGGTLPLAGPVMYSKLNPHWAGTLLGLVQVVCIPIPVIFYKYGGRIRMKSTLISSMQRDKERLEGKKSKMNDEENKVVMAREREEEKAVEVVAEAGIAGVLNREKELGVIGV